MRDVGAVTAQPSCLPLPANNLNPTEVRITGFYGFFAPANGRNQKLVLQLHMLVCTSKAKRVE
jgi:hypothetical protein